VVMWQHTLSMSVMRTTWTRDLDWLHSVQITCPRSTHYRHTKRMLPHNHDGLIILF